MLEKIKNILQANGIELNFVPGLPEALQQLYIEEMKMVVEPGKTTTLRYTEDKENNAITLVKATSPTVEFIPDLQTKFFEVEKFPAQLTKQLVGPYKNLQEIKNEFFADIKKIKPCPVCGQKAKEYTRTIDSSLAWSLIALYRANKKDPEKQYHHVNELIKTFSSSGMAKLRFWGLVEPKPNKDKKKKESGLYKITNLGIDFAEQKCTVQKYATTYNNEFKGLSGDQINIIDALGTKFNYQQLMSQ